MDTAPPFTISIVTFLTSKMNEWMKNKFKWFRLGMIVVTRLMLNSEIILRFQNDFCDSYYRLDFPQHLLHFRFSSHLYANRLIIITCFSRSQILHQTPRPDANLHNFEYLHHVFEAPDQSMSMLTPYLSSTKLCGVVPMLSMCVVAVIFG